MSTNEQFYKLTLSDAIAQYKAKLISATALVFYYLRVKGAQGWTITIQQGEACKDLGIAKSTFYKAIAKLLEKNLIEIDDTTGIKVKIPQIEESSLQTVDSSLQTVDSSLQTVDSSLQTVEKQGLEPLHSKGSSPSSDYYQIFTNSLSDSERESFLKFGEKMAASLPKPPTLINRWIEKNFEDIRAQWLKAQGKDPSEAQKNQKWENHPNREEWLLKINKMGGYAFASESGKRDPEKFAFFQWARKEGLG